jgi:asparagine synthase (glutamine-hydrolysing)
MLDTIQHRGPDDRAVHEHPAGATLGHTRLSIIDPGGGRQPLIADGTALVCNGMIYNDRLLRARIGPDRFHTATDSESILQGYLAWGNEVVDRIDGMFAFVLVDGNGRCVAARDPLGKKPLFWGRVGEAIVFASEIKALDGIAEDIEAFPAGCVWDSRDGLRQYYSVPLPQDDGRSEREAIASVRVGLERAVVRRLRSDVPLGAFLSGGLDSSVIAAIAQRHLGNLHTYAVGLVGSSDLAAARKVAEHLGTIHHEYVIGPEEITAALPRVIRHLESYDRDLVRSAVPTWFVAREAARDMKVILTGEGADELFAGYAYHADYMDGDALQAELHRSLTAMHSINLQRVDRMTMAHSLEARVPFLDREMIDLAMTVPAALKQRPEQACDGEKWILRKACEDLLPAEIVWRGKLQFDEGSGFSDYLADHARREFEAGAIESAGPDVSPEEALYRQLLRESDVHTDAVMGLTDHWRSGRTVDRAA